MHRRDLTTALLASVAAPGVRAQTASCAQACFQRTAAEIAGHIAPANDTFPTQPAVDVRRYGAVGDGVTDDSAAIATAFSLGAASGLAVLFPYGCTFRITRYIEMRSNVVVYLLGQIHLTDRASGLYANGASHIAILGFRTGGFRDTTVQASYRWNNYHVPWAPSIHLRSCQHVLIDGVRFTYCPQGVLISNAAENRSPPNDWHLTQEAPVDCTVRGCHIEHCEMSGMASYNAVDTRYLDNYVYRCGDGGIWMMGARDCEVVGNHRISPQARPAAVAAFGSNHPDHPDTWNDEQGIEFENCHGLLVAHNVVKGLWAYGIDIKNVCNRVLVTGNRVSDCENASIAIRAGDSVKDACHKVSIIGNTVSGHGTLHYGREVSGRGAIRVGDCYITEVLDNVIYAYRGSPGIQCEGPLDYQAIHYRQNPHQGSLVVSRNTFSFKADAFENEHEFPFDQNTLSAILITGQYDCVKVSDNQISTDRYLAEDPRENASAAITLSYLSANGTHYPTSVSISDNQVSGWGHWGILVQGLPEVASSGLAVVGNIIASTAGGGGIRLAHTRRALVSGNLINRIVAGSGFPGIWLEGSSGQVLEEAVVTGNQIVGGGNEAGSNMTHGVRFDHCADCNVTNNRISFATVSPVGTYHVTGEMLLAGTTGFPRSGGGSPAGTVIACYAGEPYWDLKQGAWWTATAGGSTAWTRSAG
jgi:hypothetical protein